MLIASVYSSREVRERRDGLLRLFRGGDGLERSVAEAPRENLVAAAIGMKHGLERKTLLRAALRVLANEGEVANRSAAQQAHELGRVLARVVHEVGQNVGVARLGKCRNVCEHGRT